MPFFITAAHGNVTRVENPAEIVRAFPTGPGFQVIGRRNSGTWLQCTLQVPKRGDKINDVRVVADLGQSATLKHVHVWIGGGDRVLHEDNLNYTGHIDETISIPGDPVLDAGINISLFVEFGNYGNEMDRRAVIRSFDSELETDSAESPAYSMKEMSHRLSSK